MVMESDEQMDASLAGVYVQKAGDELHRVRWEYVIGTDLQHHQLHHSKVCNKAPWYSTLR